MLALPPISAEPIFHLAALPVTNSLINSVLALIGFIIFAFFLNRGIRKYYVGDKAPKGLLNFFEGVLDFLLKYIDRVTHDRKKSLKFLPLVGSLFLFILASNWLGLFPGVGSISRCYSEHAHQFVSYSHCSAGQAGYELFPILRPANTDLNMTLSMAVLAVVASHFLGIAAIGFFKYANKFIKFGDLFKAVKSLKPVNMLVAFIEFFVGLIEVVSEIAKMISLSLRLFGNIFAGEVLMTVLAGLIPYLVPLPFMALELLVGFVQAVVFSMLTLVYLTMATTEVHEHEESKEGKTPIIAAKDETPAV